MAKPRALIPLLLIAALLIAALIAAIGNGRAQDEGQGRLVETLRQRVEALEADNPRLRQRNGNGNPLPQATPG